MKGNSKPCFYCNQVVQQKGTILFRSLTTVFLKSKRNGFKQSVRKTFTTLLDISKRKTYDHTSGFCMKQLNFCG